MAWGTLNSGGVGTEGKDGKDGITPHIGENGNWYIGETDTQKPSRGEKGDKGEDGAPGKDGAAGPAGPTGPAGPVVPATKDTLGGVKVGKGLFASEDGTLNVRLVDTAGFDFNPFGAIWAKPLWIYSFTPKCTRNDAQVFKITSSSGKWYKSITNLRYTIISYKTVNQVWPEKEDQSYFFFFEEINCKKLYELTDKLLPPYRDSYFTLPAAGRIQVGNTETDILGIQRQDTRIVLLTGSTVPAADGKAASFFNLVHITEDNADTVAFEVSCHQLV